MDTKNTTSRMKRKVHRKKKTNQYLQLYTSVLSIIQENPFISMKDIHNRFLTIHGSIMFSISTLRRIMKYNRIVYKKATWRTPSKSNIEGKEQYIQTLNQYKQNGYNIISIDETGFINNQMPIKGYCKKGFPLKASKCVPKRSKLSCIMAISDSGAYWENYKDENINGCRFCTFICNIIQQVKSRNCVFIMDNIVFHKKTCKKHH